MKNLIFILCLCFAFIFAACKKSDPEVASSKSAVIKVNSRTEMITTWAGTKAEVMMYQEGDDIGTDRWMYIYEIEGFTFEPGYTYALQVRKEKLANPPQDASDTRYALVRVINKVKV